MELFAELFAWHPYRCGLVALALSVSVFLPFYRILARMCFFLAALVWWWLTYTEFTTPHDLNIRVDLVFTLRAAMFLGIVAMVAMAIGWRRNV
ncbi:hypothetical protein D3878_11840 [Noviherbaspirillum sedimenti]|uniref:Uncharacterized protein n=1 Tax=Noviherbaspirillum sedimenti TaxID=2320865 RepID=A0A3A3G3E2_9BURK|nr:hypothetical protein D3878_11840 [Noviherbaspirillum sedimenti]